MFLTDITSPTSVGILEKTLSFTETRNKMIATNIANITTPGYRTKQLDVKSFQKTLDQAAKKADKTGAFEMESVHPTEEPAENLLFQDGTNARIERQMSMLAENTMMNQAASSLLKSNYDTIGKAIRGHT